jgi:hypothetical protein
VYSALPAVAAAQATAADSGADPFARGAWHLELSAQVFAEAWNYNVSREELYVLAPGLVCPVRDGLAIVAAVPMGYVSQRATDAAFLGVTAGVRWRAARRGRASLFLELSVGAAQADTPVPPRGTRVNYLFAPAGGVTIALPHGAHLLVGLRWLHLSNNSLAGRDRNPDIQAIGVQAGLLLPF